MGGFTVKPSKAHPWRKQDKRLFQEMRENAIRSQQAQRVKRGR